MRRFSSFIVFGFAISFGAILFADRAAAQGWGYGPVVVFDERDGRGRSQGFDEGVFLNNRGQLGTIGNDRATSVHVSAGYRVRFCENEGTGNGAGRCEEFGEGNFNLRYPRSASYIRVTGRFGGGSGGGWGGGGGLGRQGVTVYDDRDFKGRSQNFGPGRYLNSRGQLGAIRNDEASSVVVQRGYRVRFCESEGSGNGEGKCDEYGEGRYNLRLNDEASYIEVRRSGGWGGGPPVWGGGGDEGWGSGNPGPGFNAVVTVYSERNQRGDRQTFGVGTFRNDRNQLGNIKNDDATSISVPRGMRARVCSDDGNAWGGGRCDEYGPGNYNLRVNDEMSFITVWWTGY